MNFFYRVDEDGDWVQLDSCQHPRTPYVAQAMLQQLGGNVDLVRIVVREWNVAEIIFWKQNQTRRFMRPVLSHLTEVQFDYTMACLFRNFGGDVWTVARVYSVTMAALRINNSLSKKEIDVVRDCAVSHFLHGADVDTYGTAMFGLKMLSSYEEFTRYPAYVYASFGRFSEWVPP